MIEKLLCHDGTRGLEISINDNPWIKVPEAESIAEPPWDYQHHTYPIVPLPLSQLSADGENQFRLRVGDEHPWNWPQHLIYGVHLRIYYEPVKKPHPAGHLVAPQAGDKLSRRDNPAGRSHKPQRTDPPSRLSRSVRGCQSRGGWPLPPMALSLCASGIGRASWHGSPVALEAELGHDMDSGSISANPTGRSDYGRNRTYLPD